MYCHSPCQSWNVGNLYGTEKSCGVLFSSALLMKRFQIVAGNVPPATEMPCTSYIGISARW